MNDFLGGNNYQQTDEQLKAKKMMKVVGVILVLLLILVIVLIALMYYIQSTQLKISLDGQANNALKDVLIIQDGKVYVPIRAFAQYVGYESANGDYKQYEEDTTKCYVENANEVASFSLDSNTIYKIVLDGNNDYEYYEIEEPVVMINNQLCTTIEGARIAFNLSMAYDTQNNQIGNNTDNTTSDEKIPQTGEDNYILISIAAIVILSVIFYIKYMQYRKNV